MSSPAATSVGTATATASWISGRGDLLVLRQLLGGRRRLLVVHLHHQRAVRVGRRRRSRSLPCCCRRRPPWSPAPPWPGGGRGRCGRGGGRLWSPGPRWSPGASGGGLAGGIVVVVTTGRQRQSGGRGGAISILGFIVLLRVVGSRWTASHSNTAEPTGQRCSPAPGVMQAPAAASGATCVVVASGARRMLRSFGAEADMRRRTRS